MGNKIREENQGVTPEFRWERRGGKQESMKNPLLNTSEPTENPLLYLPFINQDSGKHL